MIRWYLQIREELYQMAPEFFGPLEALEVILTVVAAIAVAAIAVALVFL